jgi:hypothetical protein
LQKKPVWERVKHSFSDLSVKKETELIVMTFCFDRLGQQAKLEVAILKMDGNKAPGSSNSVVMDFDGWRVIAMRSKGELFSPPASFDIDVYYTQTSEMLAHKELIATFSNLKHYPPDTGSGSIARGGPPAECKGFRRCRSSAIKAQGTWLLQVRS